MFLRKLRVPLVLFAAILLPANFAWALGEQLGETKEQLKLKYDVSVTDHGTGRVTVVLTIADQGRLKPLSSVDLVVLGKEYKEGKGYSGYVDLSVALAIKEEAGKQVVRIHVLKELAERAQIQLQTSSLDGKKQTLTWYYYAIPIAKYLKNEEQKND
jgi:hypothetical protein